MINNYILYISDSVLRLVEEHVNTAPQPAAGGRGEVNKTFCKHPILCHSLDPVGEHEDI